MTAQSIPAKRARWPRIHLIYFLLAAFDIVAVGSGLFLSYRLSTVFEDSIATNDEWGQRFVSFWSLNDLVSDVSAPGNEVFQTKNLIFARANFDKATKRLTGQIAATKADIAKNLPAELADPVIMKLNYVDQALTYVEGHGKATFKNFAFGDTTGAVESLALMNKSATILRKRLNEAVLTIRDMQGSFADVYRAKVEALKRFEFVLGGGILFIVCCVVAYGHWVGNFLTRKYRELQAAHAASMEAETETNRLNGRLATVNEDIGNLNRDLQDNLTKLAEAQDEVVKTARLASLGQLTATVAHEIRNPMATVRTAAFLLERKLKGKGFDAETPLKRIAGGINRCEDIITQLLDFSRSGNLQLAETEIDDWLASAVTEIAASLPQAVSIECNFGLGAAMAQIDKNRMNRVLINLIGNASEAMVGKGEDASKFFRKDPRIEIESRRSARGIEVVVSDNGPGIPEDVAGRILEPLFTTKSFGTGLGLPAVDKIIRDHGGGLEFRPAQGGGAVFTVWIPETSVQGVAA